MKKKKKSEDKEKEKEKEKGYLLTRFPQDVV